jgi:glycosyltransferase involved in cell wall biosynthesis
MSDDIFLSLCAPAYNEEASIEAVVRDWQRILTESSINAEIIIGNDGSQDRTGEILARLQTEFPNLVVVSHAVNGGYGRALRSAMAAARGQYVLTLDSDGQFDAAEWRPLHQELLRGDYDLVTGYRHAKQASWLHVAADRSLNRLIRMLFGLKLRDTNCALKLFKGEVARKIGGEAMGYPTPTEFHIRAQTLGFRTSEIRITHRERAGGATKLKAFKVSWQMALFLLYLKFKQWLYHKRILTAF